MLSYHTTQARVSSGKQQVRRALREWRSHTAVIAAFCLLIVFTWSYWPTLVSLADTWWSTPDYSHGFLVVPVACYLLWARRDRLQQIVVAPGPGGVILIAASVLLRVIGSVYFLNSLDGWSIPLWLGGVVWLFGGRQLFLWALPGLAFLVFMVPIPWRLETALNLPLQSIAASISCWLLQSLMQPAILEGNTVLLGDVQLEVEQACSGLRMFFGIAALVAVYIVLIRRPVWQKVAIVLALAPIAILANAVRITATGLFCEVISSSAARQVAHDLAGWVVIPCAAGMIQMLFWFMDKLLIEVQHMPVAPRSMSEQA